MVQAAVSGFVVAFSAMITISLLVWAMTMWGSGFIFAVDADHIEGYHSPQIEAAAWDRLGGIPALFAQLSPGISLLVMSLWVGFSGAIFGLFAVVLALLAPWPRLAFLGPVIWFQFCLLATGSMLSPIGWVSPHDALYPWNLSLLLIPGRVVGLAMYTAPLLVGIWFIFRRTERIASMQ